MNAEIAARLQRLRKQCGFSQEELAEKIGVSRQAVSKWERGESSPEIENLIALAKLYGTSLDSILETASFPYYADDRGRGGISLNKNDYLKKEEPAQSEFAPAREAAPFYEPDEIYPQKRIAVTDGLPGAAYAGSGYAGLKYKPFWEKLWDKAKNSALRFASKKASPFYPIFVAVIYLCVFIPLNAFLEITWMIFLTIPLYYTGKIAIRKRNPLIFAYPVLVVMYYIFMSFLFNNFTFFLSSFLTIPMYYTIFPAIKRKNPYIFCFPALVAWVYLNASSLFGGYRFFLPLYVAVPVYYMFAGKFKK